MGSVSGHRRRAIELALGVDELKGIQKLAALVALVSAGILIAAARPGTSALDEAVSEEGFVLLAVWLSRSPLLEEAVLVELQEGVLDNLGLIFRGCSPEVVEGNVEPVVDSLVFGVELVAERLGSNTSLEGPSLGRSACPGVFLLAKFLANRTSEGKRSSRHTILVRSTNDYKSG